MIYFDVIVQAIRNKHVKKADELGLVPIMDKFKVSVKTTIDNYMAECANIDGIHIVTSVTSKITTRYTAENSLISSMALLGLVACTHFVVVEEKD